MSSEISRQRRCFVVTWFYPEQPGYLDFSYRVHALAGRYRVTLIARAKIVHQELLSDQIDYLVIPTADCHTASLFRYIVRVSAQIRKTGPDLVMLLGSHVSAVKLLIGAVPTATYWNEHPTHYLSPTGRNFVTRYLRFLFRGLLYRGANRSEVIMPIGEAHRDDLLAHGAAANRVRLIYMGASSRFSPSNTTSDSATARFLHNAAPLQLIYTGTVMRERGRDVMLEGLAIANASQQVASLTMVGAQPEQIAYCEKRAQELGIGESLRVMGRVPGDAIPGLLAAADAGICIWEDRLYWRFNPPTKLFEYLVAGLPVLGSNIRTHTDYIRDWENGVIFEYTPESFAECIGELWRRRAELPRMRACALAESPKYLWTQLEKQFLASLPFKDESDRQ